MCKMRLAASLVLMIAPLLLMIDLPNFFCGDEYIVCKDIAGEKTESESPGLSDDIRGKLERYKNLEPDFLMRSYENAVKEIRDKINHEHQLFILKFSLVGAVLGFLFVNYRSTKMIGDNGDLSPLREFCVWASVAVAAIVDVRTFFNVNITQELGMWIRSVEPYILASGVQGWETYFFSESSLLNAPSSILVRMDRQLLTWVLYIVVTYQFVILRGEKTQSSVWRDLLPLLLCIILFGFVGHNFYYHLDGGFTFYILFFLFIMAISSAAYCFIRRQH